MHLRSCVRPNRAFEHRICNPLIRRRLEYDRQTCLIGSRQILHLTESQSHKLQEYMCDSLKLVSLPANFAFAWSLSRPNACFTKQMTTLQLCGSPNFRADSTKEILHFLSVQKSFKKPSTQWSHEDVTSLNLFAKSSWKIIYSCIRWNQWCQLLLQILAGNFNLNSDWTVNIHSISCFMSKFCACLFLSFQPELLFACWRVWFDWHKVLTAQYSTFGSQIRQVMTHIYIYIYCIARFGWIRFLPQLTRAWCSARWCCRRTPSLPCFCSSAPCRHSRCSAWPPSCTRSSQMIQMPPVRSQSKDSFFIDEFLWFASVYCIFQFWSKKIMCWRNSRFHQFLTTSAFSIIQRSNMIMTLESTRCLLLLSNQVWIWFIIFFISSSSELVHFTFCCWQWWAHRHLCIRQRAAWVDLDLTARNFPINDLHHLLLLPLFCLDPISHFRSNLEPPCLLLQFL